MPASIKHLTDKKLNLTSLLARWKDGLYYTAAIVKCDKANKRCLVCFEDGSEVWINNRDVHLQLTLDQLSEDEDIVCCICDEGHSEPPNEIILCDVCQQGYHQKCHTPTVDSSKIDETEETSDHKDWFCATCSYILNQSDCAKLSATVQQQLANQQEPQSPRPIRESTRKPSSAQLQSTTTTSPTTRQKPKSKPPQSPDQSKPHTNQSHQQQATRSSRAGSSAPQPQHNTSLNKSTIGPMKTSVSQPVQKPAPYYPLSTQARSATASSTAALASMTASSALVVGSSAGRTKQDLVNQSNRGSQKSNRPASTELDSLVSPPVKHAVRKSSVNFTPVKQSALPIATRSVIPHIAPPVKPIHPVPSTTQVGSITLTVVPLSTPTVDKTKVTGIETPINKDTSYSVSSISPIVTTNLTKLTTPQSVSSVNNLVTSKVETESKQTESKKAEEKVINDSSTNGSKDIKTGNIPQSEQ